MAYIFQDLNKIIKEWSPIGRFKKKIEIIFPLEIEMNFFDD